ncbi:MAG TPA: crosslink repair DNA glycosylase YcaQ family protein [Anaerolineales bacterium]
MKLEIPPEFIRQYRAGTFRTLPGKRIKSKEEAVDFVNERGFVYFWPIKDIVLPSLWVAVAGDRPVADEHDDPGHVTWGWKDALLGSRQWYYAKVLRQRATMISLEVVPFFFALSSNYGAPESDYLTLYEQGKLTQEAKSVYESLLEKSPLDTVQLRQKTRLTSRDSDYRFNRAMNELQSDFKILPVGVTNSGGWRYAFAFDLVSRHLPEIPEKARLIQESEARRKLVEIYFRSVGAGRLNDLAKLFGWRLDEIEKAIDDLVKTDVLRPDLRIEGENGGWILLADLVEN